MQTYLDLNFMDLYEMLELDCLLNCQCNGLGLSIKETDFIHPY